MSPRANENSIRSFVWHQLVIRNNNHNVNRTLQAQGSAECQNEVGGLWESGIRPKARKHIQPLNHTGFTITSKELADTASEIKRLFPIGFWWTGNIPHAVMSTPAHRHQRSSGFNNSWEHITGLSTTFKHLYNIYLFEYLYFPWSVSGSARVVEQALRKGLTGGSNLTSVLLMCVALRRNLFFILLTIIPWWHSNWHCISYEYLNPIPNHIHLELELVFYTHPNDTEANATQEGKVRMHTTCV